MPKKKAPKEMPMMKGKHMMNGMPMKDSDMPMMKKKKMK